MRILLETTISGGLTDYRSFRVFSTVFWLVSQSKVLIFFCWKSITFTDLILSGHPIKGLYKGLDDLEPRSTLCWGVSIFILTNNKTNWINDLIWPYNFNGWIRVNLESYKFKQINAQTEPKWYCWLCCFDNLQEWKESFFLIFWIDFWISSYVLIT